MGNGNKDYGGSLWLPEQQLIQPVPEIHQLTSPQDPGYRNSEEEKPVEEPIEDDVKYDFRTQTHYID